MAPEEVLRRAEAFDPLPIEPLGCPCEFCAATKRMKREHAIMRLALEMIAQKCEQRARFGDRDTLNMITWIAAIRPETSGSQTARQA